jgi:hypothetical protein
MPNVRDIVNKVGEVADMVDDFIPQAGLAKGGAQIIGGLLDVLDGLKKDAPDPTTAEAIEQHRAKVAAIQAKAERTSDRLRGG